MIFSTMTMSFFLIRNKKTKLIHEWILFKYLDFFHTFFFVRWTADRGEKMYERGLYFNLFFIEQWIYGERKKQGCSSI